MRKPALVMVPLLAACATHTPEPEPTPAFRDAIYQFSEQLPGTDRMVAGTVRLLGNMAIIDAQPGPCRNLPARNERSSAYQCDDVLLVADMTTPTLKVTYQTTKTVRETKSTCVRYETNASGLRVCLESKSEYVERQVPISGTLRLRADSH